MQYITIQTSGVSKIFLLFEINVYIHSAKMQWISIKKYKTFTLFKNIYFFFKESWNNVSWFSQNIKQHTYIMNR